MSPSEESEKYSWSESSPSDDESEKESEGRAGGSTDRATETGGESGDCDAISATGRSGRVRAAGLGAMSFNSTWGDASVFSSAGGSPFFSLSLFAGLPSAAFAFAFSAGGNSAFPFFVPSLFAALAKAGVACAGGLGAFGVGCGGAASEDLRLEGPSSASKIVELDLGGIGGMRMQGKRRQSAAADVTKS